MMEMKDNAKIRVWTTFVFLIGFLLITFSFSLGAESSDESEIAPINPQFMAYVLNDGYHSLSSEKSLLLQQQPNFSVRQSNLYNHFSYGYRPSPIDTSYLCNLGTASAQLSVQKIPPTYDLRTMGKITAVKEQGSNNSNSWTFAAYGSLESCLLPGGSQNFSENHLKNTHGFDYGGNAYMATAYLTRWGGPVNEVDDPYDPYSGLSQAELTVQKHVQEVIQLPDCNKNEIKNAIMTYGAVYTTMCYWDDFFNPTTYSYYDDCPNDWRGNGNNLAVTIVGWIDNYPKANFKNDVAYSSLPLGDGAWIVKNSLGTSWGENGYFYVSYYDNNFGRENFVFTNAEPTDNYQRKYEYDPYGDVLNYGDGNTWMANVFTADASEPLAAIGFYALAPNTSYTLKIYTDVATLPNTGSLAITKTGTIAKAGYHTITLPNPVLLTAQHKFSVVIQVTTPGYQYPIPIEAKQIGLNGYAGYNYTSNATSHAGESFISKDGKTWADLIGKNILVKDNYGVPAISYTNLNACIKAYTRTYPIITAQPASQTIDAETDFTFRVNVFDQTGDTFTYQWYYNDIPIQSATSSTLTLYKVSPDNNGDYYVIVTNTHGKITSQKATLTVRPLLPPPMLDLNSGTYTTPQNVSVFYSPEYSGITMRYTTDGKTEPTATSPVLSQTAPLKIAKTSTVKVRAFKTGYTTSHTVTAAYTITGIVATPTFNKLSGTYMSPLNVVIKCTPPVVGATPTIRYTITTDGSEPPEPTVDSPVYTAGVNGLSLDQDITIKAKAWYPDWETSATATATYNLAKAAKPTFSLKGDVYPSTQTVTIKCSTSGVKIRYTTDGTNPTADKPGIPGHGTVGTTVKISTDCTLRAIAYRTGFIDSDVGEATYYIGTVAAPKFTNTKPAPAIYSTSETVGLIVPGNNNAKIYYTTDGSTPTQGSKPYDSANPIQIEKPMTIKARAFETNKIASPVVSAAFNVKVPTQPAFEKVAGNSPSEQTIRITCKDPDATIRYTTTTGKVGVTPNSKSIVIKSGDLIQIDHTQILEAAAFKSGWAPSDPTINKYTVTTAGTVATPTFDQPSGTYKADSTISINCATQDATIRYTTDGTTPTGISDEYTAPIKLENSTVIKAKAFKDGMKSSAVATGTYILKVPTKLEFKTVAGSSPSEQTVQITCDDPSATIRYTTTTGKVGITPTTTSTMIKSGSLLQIDHTQILMAVAFKPGWAPSDPVSKSYTVTTSGIVTTPTFRPTSGTYTVGSTININCATGGATIYYTTDGSTPTPTADGVSTQYTGPIMLTKAMVIKAKAFKDSMKSSVVATGTYTAALPQPEINLASGTYPEEQIVKITYSMDGTIIRYTTNGTEPTATSPIAAKNAMDNYYTVLVNKSMTLKAKAFMTGWASSISYATATYTINKLATPTFSVDSGTYSTAQRVTINCATVATKGHAIVIHYTLNGANPTATGSPTCTPGSVITIPVTNNATTIHLKAIAVQTDGLADSNIKSADYTMTGTVATPTFYCVSKDVTFKALTALAASSETYASGLRVTISCTTPDAVIHYTTNGKEPTVGDPSLASGSTVTIESTTTLKAKAFKENWIPSATKATIYTILQTATPVINITGTTATITCATPGATIRYTTNGNDPSLSDPVIVSGSPVPPSMAAGVILKAKAWKTGMVPSKVALARLQYTLTINNDEHGTTDPSNKVTVNHGESTSIHATAANGYHFVNWTQISGSGIVTFGNANSASTTVKVISGDATIQANFAHNPYSLTVTSDGNGNISPSGTVAVSYGASQIITATPNDGYHFVNWEKIGGTGTVEFINPNAAKTAVTVTGGDVTIRANFIAYHILVVTNDGCGSTTPLGAVTLNNGANMTIKATPLPGGEFLNWTKSAGTGTVLFGDPNSADTIVRLTDGDATIQANFAMPLNTWIVGSIFPGGSRWYCFKAKIGAKYGIRSDGYADSGKYSGFIKMGAYQKDLTTAYFTGASGCYSYPRTITALEDYVYILVQGIDSNEAGSFGVKVNLQNLLTVTNDGNGSTTPFDSKMVNEGESTAIKATPNAGCQFVNWTQTGGAGSAVFGDASSANTTVTVTGGDATIQANFSVNQTVQYKLTVTGDGNGSITPSGDVSVNNGVSIPITATPNTGYVFAGWVKTAGTGRVLFDDAASANTNVTVISGDATIKAKFAVPLPVNTWTSGNIAARGSMLFRFSAIKGTQYAINWDGNYDSGKYNCNVKVTAYQKDLLTTYFSGAQYGYSSPKIITAFQDCFYILVEGNYYYDAGNFAVKVWSPLYSLTVINDGNGSTTPSGVLPVTNGVSTAITATPNQDCQFVNWTQTGGTGIVIFGDAASANTTATVTDGNATIRANFGANSAVQYSLNVGSDGNGSTNPFGVVTVNNGVNATVTAIPNTGYQFGNWTKIAGTGTVVFENPNSANTSVTVLSGDATIQANFIPVNQNIQYTLTVINDGNGTTTPSNTVTVNHGAITNISAYSHAGYQFTNWTQTAGTGTVVFGDSNSANTTVVVTGGDATIQANFVYNYNNTLYTMTVTNNVGGSTNPSGILPVNNGISTAITATPNEGYQFEKWKETDGYGKVVFGDAISPNTTATVTGGNVTIQAIFALPLEFNTWTPGTIPAGGSMVFRIPATVGTKYAINWDDKRQGSGNYSCSVGVSAFRNDLSTPYFSNNYSGYNSPRIITALDDCIYVEVKGWSSTDAGSFAVKAVSLPYTLTVTSDGNGSITPSSATPLAIDAITNITATPNASCQFVNWTQTGGTGTVVFGDPNSTNTTVAVSGGDATIEANFSVDTTVQYQLNVYYNSNFGNGSVSPYNWVWVNNGLSTPIKATPYTGYQFVKWTQEYGPGAVAFGDAHSANTTVTVTSGNAQIWANFGKILPFNTWVSGDLFYGNSQWFVVPTTAGTSYAISWDDYYQGSGNYTGNIFVSAYQKDLATSYFEGIGFGYISPQIITAFQDYIYILVHGASTIHSATFALKVIPSPDTLTVNNDGDGNTTPSGIVTVSSGVSANITATPNAGCQFVNWTQTAGTGSAAFGDANSASTTVTVTGGNATIQANFSIDHTIQYSLTVTDDGNGSTNPLGAITVNNGEGTMVTATPNIDGQFLNWTKTTGTGKVNFSDLNSATTTVTLISGDATIRANFAMPLSFSTWTTGNISAGSSQWYCFKAIKGAKYIISWDDDFSGSGKYTCWYLKVSAFQKDLSTAYFTEATDGYNSPRLITALDDYVYLQVQGYLSSFTGSFAVKVGAPQNTLTVITGENGNINPSGAITVIDEVYTSITATPNVGCRFVNWMQTGGTGTVVFGDPDSASTTVSISGGDATIRANFSIDYTIPFTLYITNSVGGSTAPSGAETINNGVSTMISAISDADCKFINWTQTAGTGSVFFGDPKSATTTVTVTSGNATVRANFAEPLSLGSSWTSGNITVGGSQWYCLKAIAGTQYTIKWDDANWGSGNYPCDVKVSVFHKDLATVYFSGVDSGYNSPLTITALEDYVYIQVQGYYSTSDGCFAIKVY